MICIWKTVYNVLCTLYSVVMHSVAAPTQRHHLCPLVHKCTSHTHTHTNRRIYVHFILHRVPYNHDLSQLFLSGKKLLHIDSYKYRYNCTRLCTYIWKTVFGILCACVCVFVWFLFIYKIESSWLSCCFYLCKIICLCMCDLEKFYVTFGGMQAPS